MNKSLDKHVWWDYLEEDLQELLRESTLLLDKVEKWEKTFHDYSFIVFPAAKAYEGFLKKLFLDLGFITEKQFSGRRFRVGKALNPSLDRRLWSKYSVYHKLINYCAGNEDLADVLWESWRQGRNLLFHWFPKEKNAISYKEAGEKVSMILHAMDKAFKECKIGRDYDAQKRNRH
jgi:uncharacterized protein with HEPN domain